MSEVKGERKQSHPQKPQADNPLVTCPRCGGDGGDRYLCGLCNGQGRVCVVPVIHSLLDSQAAGVTFVGPCVACHHNNYNAELGECDRRWIEGRMSVVCGCPCAKHNSLANAATQMRDKCVAELYVMKAEQEAEGGYPQGSGIFAWVAKRLESLTLDQVERETK